MRTIGITGGVGAGKSRVLQYISDNYDARIIIADLLAKKLEEPGEICYQRLVEYFGTEILADDQRIDKIKFAEKIFGNKENLAVVNGIVHPAVKEYILHAMETEKKAGRELFFVEAALLIEEGYHHILDEMWYIYASENTRRRRLKESRGYSDEKIDSLFSAQKSEEEFREICDFEINNDVTLEEMEGQIAKYLAK